MPDVRERAVGVLVVEDDPTLTGLISLVLNRSGFVVEVAATCRGALETVHRRRPAVVLVDLQLKQGVELCLALKANASTCRLPVLALVAPLPGLVEQRMRKHADAFLPKPFELHRLIETVQHLVSRAQPDGEPEADVHPRG